MHTRGHHRSTAPSLGLAVMLGGLLLAGLGSAWRAGVCCAQGQGPATLTSLEIIGPDPPVASNRLAVVFQCLARDSSGQKRTIHPRWQIEPQEAGTISYSRDAQVLTYLPHDDFIGQLRVAVTDSLSGLTAEYNASDSLSECDRGLAIYLLLAGDAPETIVGDRRGMRLAIPPAAIPSGDTALIFLRQPAVLEVKRITPHHQVHGQIYDLRTSTPVSWMRSLELTLPVVPSARSREATIGRWSCQQLEWLPLGGTSGAEEISVQVDSLSQFAVLTENAPLELTDIQLLPNPFTPNDPYGLQLGFTLSADHSRSPFVTIKIYNLAGDLVRTICQNEPLPKGTYRPGESFLDSRGRDITCWDGRTDDGQVARNGRYVVHFQATDSGGAVEALRTAVLIK